MNTEFFPLILSGLFVLSLAAVGLAFVFFVRTQRLKKVAKRYHDNTLFVCELAGYKLMAKQYQNEFDEDFKPAKP